MIDDVLMSWVMGSSHQRSLDLSMFEDISRVFGKCSIDLVEDFTEWIGGANSSASSGLGEFACGVLRTQIVIRKI
jgi:hypothetical protein